MSKEDIRLDIEEAIANAIGEKPTSNIPTRIFDFLYLATTKIYEDDVLLHLLIDLKPSMKNKEVIRVWKGLFGDCRLNIFDVSRIRKIPRKEFMRILARYVEYKQLFFS